MFFIKITIGLMISFYTLIKIFDVTRKNKEKKLHNLDGYFSDNISTGEITEGQLKILGKVYNKKFTSSLIYDIEGTHNFKGPDSAFSNMAVDSYLNDIKVESISWPDRNTYKRKNTPIQKVRAIYHKDCFYAAYINSYSIINEAEKIYNIPRKNEYLDSLNFKLLITSYPILFGIMFSVLITNSIPFFVSLLFSIVILLTTISAPYVWLSVVKREINGVFIKDEVLSEGYRHIQVGRINDILVSGSHLISGNHYQSIGTLDNFPLLNLSLPDKKEYKKQLTINIWTVLINGLFLTVSCCFYSVPIVNSWFSSHVIFYYIFPTIMMIAFLYLCTCIWEILSIIKKCKEINKVYNENI